mgnify:CR=1 FL=1
MLFLDDGDDEGAGKLSESSCNGLRVHEDEDDGEDVGRIGGVGAESDDD